MASKQMKFDTDARAEIASGLSQLARAVKATLGPRGRNVVLQKSFGSPRVTKDGVTVAKEIELPQPFENMGAKLVQTVVSKTGDVAGDGTTTAVALAEAIYKSGLQYVTAGVNPVQIQRGILRAADIAADVECAFRRLPQYLAEGGANSPVYRMFDDIGLLEKGLGQVLHIIGIDAGRAP